MCELPPTSGVRCYGSELVRWTDFTYRRHAFPERAMGPRCCCPTAELDTMPADWFVGQHSVLDDTTKPPESHMRLAFTLYSTETCRLLLPRTCPNLPSCRNRRPTARPGAAVLPVLLPDRLPRSRCGQGQRARPRPGQGRPCEKGTGKGSGEAKGARGSSWYRTIAGSLGNILVFTRRGRLPTRLQLTFFGGCNTRCKFRGGLRQCFDGYSSADEARRIWCV